MKLTNQEKEEIIELFKKGYSANDLAKKYNVSTTNIVFILDKVGYKRDRKTGIRLKKLMVMNELAKKFKETQELTKNKDLNFVLMLENPDRDKVKSFLIENYKLNLIDEKMQEEIVDNIMYLLENYKKKEVDRI